MDCSLTLVAEGRVVKRVCDVLGVARSNMAAKLVRPTDWRDGRTARKTDDTGLVEEIRLAIADLPSYGYRRV
jgi:putative transposase